MCGVEVTDRFIYSELKERLGADDTITVLQQNICMNCKVKDVRPRGRLKKENLE